MKKINFIFSLFLPALIFSDQLPARMSVVTGEAIIQKSYSESPEYGIANLPVEAGDSIFVKSGYVEIDIEDGSTLRIGENSSCIIIHTGKNEADNSVSTRIYANFGEFELFSSTKENTKSYLDLETDVGIVTSFPKGVFRIKVGLNGEIEAEVIKGTGAYKTKREEKLLEAGDFVTINSSGIGSIVRRPVSENSNISSTPYKPATYENQNSPSRAYVPKEIESSARTLDENGTWIYVSSHGYCWRPKVYVTDWKPYYDGEWVWTIGWGWTWVSYEPWGWWTYHYGHWVYSRRWGWVWVPGSSWYSARVVWWWGPGWIAWYPYPYYWWYPWYYDNWWVCVTRESFYRPRYRYHDPLYGFVGDKPTRTYDLVDVNPRNSDGLMVSQPLDPELSLRTPVEEGELTTRNPENPLRETPELSRGDIQPVRPETDTRSPVNERLPVTDSRTNSDLTSRNTGNLTTSRPVNERTPTINSDMTPPRQGNITSRNTSNTITTSQPTTRTNPTTDNRPETDNRNYTPPTNTRPQTDDDNRNYTPPTNTRPQTDDDNSNYTPPQNNNQNDNSNERRDNNPPQNTDNRQQNDDERRNNPPQNQRPPQREQEERRQSPRNNSR
ncbi:hypothetical protein JXA84_07665 [candidate division WOR-3 bacterium]|nr:hypothetical protein [candidate division WOR-3 bacterium]